MLGCFGYIAWKKKTCGRKMSEQSRIVRGNLTSSGANVINNFVTFLKLK